jgi:prefoldin subunit 5
MSLHESYQKLKDAIHLIQALMSHIDDSAMKFDRMFYEIKSIKSQNKVNAQSTVAQVEKVGESTRMVKTELSDFATVVQKRLQSLADTIKSLQQQDNSRPKKSTTQQTTIRNDGKTSTNSLNKITTTPASTPVNIKTNVSKANQLKSPSKSNASGKTLLVGSSILHGINPKGLKVGVHKHSKSGATIQVLKDDVSMYDIKAFQHIIIYSGGNDASRRTDPELFEERYSQLIEHIKKENPDCEISLCTVCPREDTNVEEYNKLIVDIANYYNVKCIDVYRAFLDRNGEFISRYFGFDGIHLSQSGVKRLLGTVDQHVSIVRDFDQAVFMRRLHHKRYYQPMTDHFPWQGRENQFRTNGYRRNRKD